MAGTSEDANDKLKIISTLKTASLEELVIAGVIVLLAEGLKTVISHQFLKCL